MNSPSRDPRATPAGRRLPLLASLAALPVLVALVATGPGQDRGQREALPTRREGELLAIDEAMFAVAAATGGDFYFWAPGEFARSRVRIPVGDGEAVALVYGPLGASRRTVSFPVDSTVGRLELFLGAQELTRWRLEGPDGVLDAEDPRVDLQSYRHMVLATVPHPSAGTWRVEVEGAGQHALTARVSGRAEPWAPAAIEVVAFEFVELRGRPGHEGLFPRRGLVASGEEHDFRLALSGFVDMPQLSLVSGAGRDLGPVTVHAADGGELHGRLRVPPVPFRLVVRGRDTTGLPFQRVTDGCYAPAPAAEPR